MQGISLTKATVLIPKKPIVRKTLDQASNLQMKLNKIYPPFQKRNKKKVPMDLHPINNREGSITPIRIPNGVSFSFDKENTLFLHGIRGTLLHQFERQFRLEIKGQSLLISIQDPDDLSRLGTVVSIVYRMIVGVTKGYKEKIKTTGVGYRGSLEDNQLLTLSLGYSHPVQHLLHPTIETQFNRKNNRINLSASSLPIVSSSAAALYLLKKPDVYNGKGIRYRGLKIRKKEGKKQGR